MSGQVAPEPVTKSILAVDLGTSALKVALTGIDGCVAARESEP